jgi:hypothetical protein
MAKKMKPLYRYLLIGGGVLFLAGAVTAWWILTDKFADTTTRKPHFTVQAQDFINEFQKDLKAANAKYTEKIVVVNGVVSELESADTTINVKIADTATGSYAIFAFQEQHLAEAKQLKEGDQVSIKGSCSGGAYSSILEAYFITFKRCALNK